MEEYHQGCKVMVRQQSGSHLGTHVRDANVVLEWETHLVVSCVCTCVCCNSYLHEIYKRVTDFEKRTCGLWSKELSYGTALSPCVLAFQLYLVSLLCAGCLLLRPLLSCRLIVGYHGFDAVQSLLA